METYRNAFEPLEVPDDMLQRVLTQAEAPVPRAQKRRGYPALATAACLTLVICTAVFHSWVPAPDPTDPVQVVNPIQPVEGVAELAERLPFPLKAPTQLPEGYAFAHASSVLGDLAQIVYTSGGDKLTFRMAEGAADISGDYNQYAEADTVEGVRLRGNGGTVSLATWSDEDYSYSLSASAPQSAETMLAICAHVEPVA